MVTTRGVGAVVDVGVGVESAEGVGGTLGGVKVGMGGEAMGMVGLTVGSGVELMGGLVEIGGGKVLLTCSRQPMVNARVMMVKKVSR